MQVRKIRLSYTLLHLWDRGDVDGAVQTYFHMDRPTTRQMEEGKRIHEDIAEHVMTYNTLPDWLNFPYELKIPEAEKEVIAEYNSIIDIKGLFDLYEPGDEVLFEWKSGVSDSLEHARTWQLPLYFFLSELAQVPVRYAHLVHFDQYKNETDHCVVHNTKSKREYAKNIVDSLGPEIHRFFNEQRLI